MLFLRRQLLQTLSFTFGSSFILGRKQLGTAAQTAVATSNTWGSRSRHRATRIPFASKRPDLPFSILNHETSDLFKGTQTLWMLNFRIRDLDKMAAQLRAAGIAVEIDAQSYPNGRFASLHDPEGNSIPLWQPAKPAAPR